MTSSLRRLLISASGLFLLSLVLAGVVYALHPARFPYAPAAQEAYSLTLAEALAYPEEVLWIDARTRLEFEQEHIPDAVWLSEDDWETGFLDLLTRWTPEQAAVVYCSSHACHSSQAVAERLRRELGAENIYHLQGGWEAWQAN